MNPSVVVKILQRLGFQKIRQKGSHIFFLHMDGRATVVPFHKGEDIPKGLLKKILQDIDTEWENFIKCK
ncbi:MAG: hypothetical protein COW13_03300 [Candidatus Omnitrophica bacterium CG12_big_fil_rev_8_21_14_0_65_50_5]|nr:MAG: hypothetical protein COW13_03300 [Candidatus Omnitrophica bacterium CG12_big_fil_rev_8_21_14_0_65_50_5]